MLVINRTETYGIYLKIMEELEDIGRRNRRGEYAGEEDITSQIMRSLARTININKRNIKISSTAIVSKKTTEEPTMGADAIIVIAYRSPIMKTSSGIIIQAKDLSNHNNIKSNAEMKKFRIQCMKMLRHTSESYSVIYKSELFWYQRAALITRLATTNPLHANSVPLNNLFFDLLHGLRGDSKLSFDNYPRIESTIRELKIKNVLIVSVFDNVFMPLRLRRPFSRRPYKIDEKILELQKLISEYRDDVELVRGDIPDDPSEDADDLGPQ